MLMPLFTYLGFYIIFDPGQFMSRPVVGRAEETSTYSSSGFCTVNCLPTATAKLSHLRVCQEVLFIYLGFNCILSDGEFENR